jgi:hypothetical protein
VIDPAMERFMEALVGLAVAQDRGRVSHEACAQAAATAVLALNVTRPELQNAQMAIALLQGQVTIERLARGGAA